MYLAPFITRPPLTFNEYLLQLLAFAGAGAFYCGARKFGVPRFLPSITFQTNITETATAGIPKDSYSNLKLKAPEVASFNGDAKQWYKWRTSTVSALTSTAF